MKNTRSIVLLIVLWMVAGVPAALAYDVYLPTLAAQETQPHDGDPDEPGPITSPHGAPFELETGGGSDRGTVYSDLHLLLPIFIDLLGGGI